MLLYRELICPLVAEAFSGTVQGGVGAFTGDEGTLAGQLLIGYPAANPNPNGERALWCTLPGIQTSSSAISKISIMVNVLLSL